MYVGNWSKHTHHLVATLTHNDTHTHTHTHIHTHTACLFYQTVIKQLLQGKVNPNTPDEVWRYFPHTDSNSH